MKKIMNFASIDRLVRRCGGPVLLAAAMNAQATPVQWQTSQLDIAFDPETFVFMHRVNTWRGDI
ncbi:MAG: hypothetical protein EOP40_06625 [Rubrivivax sp.]|nr:MAG: hypothetical protein EOP40_06625 [Rubrivivax sp.]